MSKKEKKWKGKHLKGALPSLDIPIEDSFVSTLEPTVADAPEPEIPPLRRNRYADSMQRKRRMPKVVRWLLWLLILGLLGFGCYKAYDLTRVDNTDLDPNAIAYAQRGYLETYVEGSGQTQAKVREDLGDQIKGEVTEVLIKAGDTVLAGDVLVVVDPTETREELTSAEEQLRLEQESLNQAGEQLAALSVSAPFAGKLLPPESGEQRFQAGDQLGGGQSIGRLVDESAMTLPLYFSYAYIDQIQKGSAATVSVPAAMGLFHATVTAVEPIEKVTAQGARLFRAILSVPNDGALSEGMLATASVAVSGGVTAVPSEAGTLSYAREAEIVLEAGRKLNTSINPYYYKYGAGQPILSLSNEELVRAYDMQKEGVTAAQKTIDEINLRIADCTVIAPIDGMVLSVNAVVGEQLKAAYPVVTVADLSALVVKASVPEMDIDKVSVGQMATISVYTENDMMQVMGEVTEVALQAEDSQGGNGGLSFPVTISVDNSMGDFSPDRYVDYQIQTAVAMDCITVPVSALVNTEMGTAVFAKPAEGQTFTDTIPIPEGTEVPSAYLLIPVVSGISDSSNVEIISGLEEGTEVYLAGPKDAYADMGGDMGMMVG